jgi:hypothetical protein
MKKKGQFCSVGCKGKQRCCLQGKQRSFFLVINCQIYNVGATCGSSAKKKYNGEFIIKNLK